MNIKIKPSVEVMIIFNEYPSYNNIYPRTSYHALYFDASLLILVTLLISKYGRDRIYPEL